MSHKKVFSDVCSQKVEDDGLSFLTEAIRVELIRDEEAYEGVLVLVEACLGRVALLERSPPAGLLIVPSTMLANVSRPL